MRGVTDCSAAAPEGHHAAFAGELENASPFGAQKVPLEVQGKSRLGFEAMMLHDSC